MLVLVGPSASGKSEVVKELVKTYPLEKFITCTTRAPRRMEKNKIDYYFLTVNDFKKLYNENSFIETVYYNGNYYGSLASEVKNDKVIILEPQGIKAFKEKIKDLFIVSLKTNPLILKDRMLKRGDSMLDTMTRLENDKIFFADDLIGSVNLVVETDHKSVKEISDEIYFAYKNYLNGGKSNG